MTKTDADVAAASALQPHATLIAKLKGATLSFFEVKKALGLPLLPGKNF